MERISKIKRKIYIFDYINLTMIEFKTKLKKWGRSFGIVVPMEKIKDAKIKENEMIEITITRKNPLKETFGTFKFKKSTQEMLDESDKEAWDE